LAGPDPAVLLLALLCQLMLLQGPAPVVLLLLVRLALLSQLM
jgi:hypothetical protein